MASDSSFVRLATPAGRWNRLRRWNHEGGYLAPAGKFV